MTMFPNRSPQGNETLTLSIRNHLSLAVTIVGILVVGMGGWATFTEIAGAVIARGTLVVESEVKQVQHREGGIVREILVREGEEVSAGDLLIRLDNTMARSNHSIIINQLSELTARRARLEAERDGKDQIEFPPRPEGIAREKAAETELRQALLMRARNGSQTKRKEQLGDQIQQLEAQISGLEAQVSAQAEELDLLDDELAGVKALFAKKLVTKNRISSLERDRTRMVGQKSELLSEIAGLKETVSERRMQILQIDEDGRAEVLQELQDVVSKIAELELQKVTVEDELNRLEIRSPRAGYVHQLAVHTIGGVVPAGETIMDIVPREDQLVVDAQVTPSDIDQVYRNQDAFIRFPGLDHRTTPRLVAKVQRVAADETIDPGTGEHYYNVRLKIPKDELAKLDGQGLVPGMPVEAFVTTANRTILSYLMQPVTDQIAHAMKEG
ncbi:HlyD family type I secretion periplasmic adaptor subunit [uncultured Roseibium sp.]|uniref:HlyD family type I secretion periplasmic adaptor subunit n=1 Tax=uncultured Roseibium sp. TaxID=1936171 RepID=UPI0032168401